MINIVAILMISAKLATISLLQIKPFWNEGFVVITFAHDLNNKILLRDSNYIVDVALWPKFGNSSVEPREVIKTTLTSKWNFVNWESFSRLVIELKKAFVSKNKFLKHYSQITFINFCAAQSPTFKNFRFFNVKAVEHQF